MVEEISKLSFSNGENITIKLMQKSCKTWLFFVFFYFR